MHYIVSSEQIRFKQTPETVSTDGRIDSGREFQTAGASAARKQQEPKVRLVRGTCKRLEEKDDLRSENTGWTVRNNKSREIR